jgi:hypothetical protein
VGVNCNLAWPVTMTDLSASKSSVSTVVMPS